MDRTARARVHTALGDPLRLGIVDRLAYGDLTPRRLAAALEVPSNLLAHHLNVLEAAGVVSRRVSEGDGRRRYVVLTRHVLGELAAATPQPAHTVLFVCTHNSARSQYAAALWRQRTGLVAESAGSEPAARVNPQATAVAAELGVDLTGGAPRGYDEVSGDPDLVVSVCDRAGEAEIPFAARRLHWSVPDPVADGRKRAFRQAFAEISGRLDALAGAVALS